MKTFSAKNEQSAEETPRVVHAIRVDLLAPERSAAGRTVIAAFYSRNARRIAVAPVLIALIVLGLYIGLMMRMAGLDKELAQSQDTYRAILRDEQGALTRVKSYDELRAVATELFRLRRSVVDRAQEIKSIANVVKLHDLHLTSISDQAATTEARAGFWELNGEAASVSRDGTCFTHLASALPDFVAVKNIASAVPSSSRDQRTNRGVCTYVVRLARSAQAQ